MKKILSYLKMNYEMWLIRQVDKHDLSFVLPYNNTLVDELDYKIHLLEEENDILTYHLLRADERIEELEKALEFYEPIEDEEED